MRLSYMFRRLFASAPTESLPLSTADQMLQDKAYIQYNIDKIQKWNSYSLKQLGRDGLFKIIQEVFKENTCKLESEVARGFEQALIKTEKLTLQLNSLNESNDFTCSPKIIAISSLAFVSLFEKPEKPSKKQKESSSENDCFKLIAKCLPEGSFAILKAEFLDDKNIGPMKILIEEVKAKLDEINKHQLAQS